MKHISIDPLHLRMALSKANRRSADRDYIYSTLDAALRRELGRITQLGPVESERPADLTSYHEDEYFDGKKRVTGWWKILDRNPTNEREVFRYFRDYLCSFVDGGKLPQLFPVQISEEAELKIRDWISDKEAELSSGCTPVTAPKSRPANVARSLEDFLLAEDKQALIDRIGTVIAGATPKQVATIVRALSEMGAVRVGTGQYADLFKALKTKQGPRDIVRYITGDRAKNITQGDIENMKNTLILP